MGSGFIERNFPAGEGHSVPHWVPGGLLIILGLMIYEVPAHRRSNILRGTKVTYLWVAVVIVAMQSSVYSGEKFYHRVHHACAFAILGLPFVLSILERHGRLAPGTSNLMFAAALMADSLLILGHPASTACEDRGHQIGSCSGIVAALAIPFLATDEIAHLCASFCVAWKGVLWFSLGFFWSARTKWWGQYADVKDPHRDMMILHLFASCGMVLLMLFIVLRRSAPGGKWKVIPSEGNQRMPTASGDSHEVA